MRILNWLLSYLFKFRFKRAGKNLRFSPIGSRFSFKTIEIGNGVFIGPDASFSNQCGNIVIGDYVMFGPRVMIFGGNHEIKKIGVPMARIKKGQNYTDPDVVIENDSWVGAGTIILPGVTVGEGAIVGAGAIVTKDVEPYAIVAGNPARFISYRFNKNEIKEHQKGLKKYLLNEWLEL